MAWGLFEMTLILIKNVLCRNFWGFNLAKITLGSVIKERFNLKILSKVQIIQ